MLLVGADPTVLLPCAAALRGLLAPLPAPVPLAGAALLQSAVANGVWERPWQAPGATFARGLWSRPIFAHDEFACVLNVLEAAAPAMAAEATALLPEFAVQAEGLATPAAGWRELNVLARCLGGADGRAPLRRSCSALNAPSVTVYGSLVSVPKEPSSTAATTLKDSAAPQPAGGRRRAGRPRRSRAQSWAKARKSRFKNRKNRNFNTTC